MGSFCWLDRALAYCVLSMCVVDTWNAHFTRVLRMCSCPNVPVNLCVRTFIGGPCAITSLVSYAARVFIDAVASLSTSSQRTSPTASVMHGRPALDADLLRVLTALTHVTEQTIGDGSARLYTATAATACQVRVRVMGCGFCRAAASLRFLTLLFDWLSCAAARATHFCAPAAVLQATDERLSVRVHPAHVLLWCN